MLLPRKCFATDPQKKMSLGAAAAAWALILGCLAVEVDALVTGVFLCGARGPLSPALATSSSGLCFLRSTARRLEHPGWRRASLALRLKMSDDSKDSHADGKAKAGARAEAEDDFSGLDDSQRKFKAAGECVVKLVAEALCISNHQSFMDMGYLTI